MFIFTIIPELNIYFINQILESCSVMRAGTGGGQYVNKNP